MPTLPCPIKFDRCAPCADDNPIVNWTSEDPDQKTFIGVFNVPPDGPVGFFSPGCQSICESTISQEDADECAERQAVECSFARGGIPSERSVFQTCTVECPDGTTFSDSVAGGTVASAWAADANARAYALACKHATQKRVCFSTDSPLTPCCVGTFASIVILAFGGTPGDGYVFSLESGSMPAGMTFDPVGLIQGTPTTAGSSTFTIRVTDAIGSFQIKEFVLRVVQITTASPLPAGTSGTAYNQAFAASDTSGTVVWTVASGSLPDGLSLATNGVISGTPTESGDFNFTVALIDGGGASCSKAFTLHVAAAIELIAYWNYDDYSPGFILDSTPDDHDLHIGVGEGNVVPGKVNDGLEHLNGFGYTLAPDTSISDFDNIGTSGFTVCGWFKFDLGEPGNARIFTGVWGAYQFFLTKIIGTITWRTFAPPDIPISIAFAADGNWHFYRAWFDPTDGKLRLQIDLGSIVSSVPHTVIDSPALDFGFGGVVTLTGTWSMDETGFWKGVLSDAEAAQLWNSGSGTTYPAVPP